jgi:hypothetical protein
MGLGPRNRDSFGPCEMASSLYRRVPFGAQKIITYGAVYITGPKIDIIFRTGLKKTHVLERYMYIKYRYVWCETAGCHAIKLVDR